MFFSKKINGGGTAAGLQALTTALTSVMGSLSTSSNRSTLSKSALSMESLSVANSEEFTSAVETLNAAMENIAKELNLSGFDTNQRNSAVAAGLMTGDIGTFLRTSVKKDIVSNGTQVAIGIEGISDASFKRTAAFEAYDEKENRNAVVYSMAYNMRAGRQDAFGEAFFPTIVISPDQVGFGVSIRLINVFNDFKRDTSGDLARYEKKNILRAVIDHSILKNDATKIVPVVRTASLKYFVDPAVIPATSVMLDDESVSTAPLAVGKTFDLLNIGQTDALLANGAMDQSDAIDSAVTLRNLYVTVGANVLRFNTMNLPLSNFVAAPQGNFRLMNLAFATTSLIVKKGTLSVDGSALAGALAGIDTGDLIVRIAVNVTGSVNLELGDTSVYGNSIRVVSVQDATGNNLDFTVAGAAKTAADAINGGAIIGFDLNAARTNSNRRQRGQLLNVDHFTQMYAVPLRAPISVARPTNTDSSTDTSDLAALITATQIRTSNEAVTTLLETSTILNSYVDSRDSAGAGPDVMGVGRFLVKPSYEFATLDMATAVDSVKSQERAADIAAVLLNKVRDMVYRLYRDSNYKAAADAMAGGEAPVPTVIIGTDLILSRYMQLNGDFRTIGPDFNLKLVSTQDARMGGRIAVAFGNFDGSGENQSDALHFGNMAWKPEITMVLPISRGGQISKELTVMPSFLHTVNCPVMGLIEVLNVTDVIASKVPVHTEIL